MKKDKPKKSILANPFFIIFGLIFVVALFVGVAVLTSMQGITLAQPDYADVVEEEVPGEEEIPEEEEEDITGFATSELGIHGFLSRAMHNGHTMYFLGSMHAGLDHFFPLHPMVEWAMEDSDVFAFEFNFYQPPIELINEIMAWATATFRSDDEFVFDIFEAYSPLQRHEFAHFVIDAYIEGLNEVDFLEYILVSLEGVRDLRVPIIGTLEGLSEIPGLSEFVEANLQDALLMEELMTLPAGMTLETVLPPEEFQNLVEVLETFPLDSFDDIAGLTPVAASMVIGGYIDGMHVRLPAGFQHISAVYSVDDYVMDFANMRGRSVIGLNTGLSETQLLLDVPMAIQATIFEGLQDFLTETALAVQLQDVMVEAYVAGDADTLIYVAIHRPMADENPYRLFWHDIFRHRCTIYAAEILRLLNETEEPTTFFVTVGAAHILHGFIFELIEAEGIQVERLWR